MHKLIRAGAFLEAAEHGRRSHGFFFCPDSKRCKKVGPLRPCLHTEPDWFPRIVFERNLQDGMSLGIDRHPSNEVLPAASHGSRYSDHTMRPVPRRRSLWQPKLQRNPEVLVGKFRDSPGRTRQPHWDRIGASQLTPLVF